MLRVVANADTLAHQLVWYVTDLLCTNRLGATYGSSFVPRLKAGEAVFFGPAMGHNGTAAVETASAVGARGFLLDPSTPLIMELMKGLEFFAALDGIAVLTKKIRNMVRFLFSSIID